MLSHVLDDFLPRQTIKFLILNLNESSFLYFKINKHLFFPNPSTPCWESELCNSLEINEHQQTCWTCCSECYNYSCEKNVCFLLKPASDQNINPSDLWWAFESPWVRPSKTERGGGGLCADASYDPDNLFLLTRALNIHQWLPCQGEEPWANRPIGIWRRSVMITPHICAIIRN